MPTIFSPLRAVLLSGVALGAMASSASAGGYAVREQSASLLGSAFAGAAAGTNLSSAFWNPAAFGTAKDGMSSENHISLITANTELSNAAINGAPAPAAIASTDIDELGYLTSGYTAYRYSDKIVLGLITGAPFGLKTNPDNENWAGASFGRGADMFTLNVTPTIAYEIADGVQVAAGLQLQHMRLKLWAGQKGSAQDIKVNIDDTVGVGFTAGILLTPTAGTSIGLGFRSKIEQELEGKSYIRGVRSSTTVRADLDTPEIVTLSIAQAIAPQWTALGTVEWTNWSRLGNTQITNLLADSGPLAAVPANIDANWDDGWFFSGGLEYAYSPVLTLRGGVAYEKSPIQEPEQRIVPLPDSDRVWLSLGATYAYSEMTTIDLGYSHVFFEDSTLNRGTITPSLARLTAEVENSADIFSIGVRTKW